MSCFLVFCVFFLQKRGRSSSSRSIIVFFFSSKNQQIYTYIDLIEREWEREAWFELDTSDREYKVLEYRPKIEREEVEGVVERLNETRDLAAFLKGMRGLFVEALK